jgi:hypothetical protein
MPYVAVRQGHGSNRASPVCLHESEAGVYIPNFTATAQSPRLVLACMHGLTEPLDEIRGTATSYKTRGERMMVSS